MILMAVMLVFGETIEGGGWFYGMHILPIPAIIAFLTLLFLLVLAYGAFRVSILSKAELLCVLFCLLTAAPIMSMGFWTNFIWLSSTIPSQGDFEKLDAINDKLWPHGPNLLNNAFGDPKNPELHAQGDVQWRETEYEEKVSATIPVLTNANPESTAALRVRVPLEVNNEAFLTLGERYLLTVLIRGTGLGAGSALRCRIYYDDHDAFDIEAFSEPQPAAKPTFLHKKGFSRCGVYGLDFARSIQDHVDIEFRLDGAGTLELADPKLMSVAAFESLSTGRQTISETEYRALRKSERSAYAVRPDSFWNWSGVTSLLFGSIPVRDWRQPVAMWGAFIGLLLLATLAVALIMRRQWIKNERYPLPMIRIPMALLGLSDTDTDETDQDTAFRLPAIWKNRTMWLGYALCLFWCFMQAWHAFNPNVPNMEINIKLKPYFDAPSWGGMWNGVVFSISAIVLSIAIFMELNVLLSLVMGFFLFRSLYWLGEANGWALASAGKYGIGAYPYANEQMISAYMTYALLSIAFTRKYLWNAFKAACSGERHGISDTTASVIPSEERELCSYRTAFLALILAFVGAIFWAEWVGIRAHAMAVLFAAMVLIGFVSMKLRTECGTPFAWFFPGTCLLIPLLGGMAFFGAQGTMLSSWTTLGMLLLFVLPGLQLEFVELARRAQIPSRHVFYTLAFGVVGGMLIGGWFFLSSLYGIGSNNTGFTYWFTTRPWEFYPYIECQRVADASILAAQQAGAAAVENQTMNPATWGYIGGAVVTAAVTILRQVFPGFWFHPIAVVLGGTADGLGMQLYWSANLWGSLLAAWAIRSTVLKLGGAVTVRTKLFPFFIGVFLAAVTAQVTLCAINAYLYFFQITATRPGVMF